mmetsp:Transcript_137170/g.293028  ORF Transcript_137170/g.293028 Transcript_137170/m.293028 type:complete len:299 (-) Transcript_137170:83-979(-)
MRRSCCPCLQWGDEGLGEPLQALGPDARGAGEAAGGSRPRSATEPSGDRGQGALASAGAGAGAGTGDAGEEEVVPEYHVRVSGFEVGRRGGRHVIFTLMVSRGSAQWPLRRRFRQVVALHNQLLQGLGRSAMKAGLPQLPPRVTCRSLLHGPHDDRFLAARASGLTNYFEALLRYIPWVDQCEALHEFLCSVDIPNMSYDALLDLGEALGEAREQEVIEPALIAALPKRSTEVSHALCGASVRCVICQESLEVDQDIRVLPCGHEYHFGCIAEWIPHSNKCCVCQSMAIQPPARPAEK